MLVPISPARTRNQYRNARGSSDWQHIVIDKSKENQSSLLPWTQCDKDENELLYVGEGVVFEAEKGGSHFHEHI